VIVTNAIHAAEALARQNSDADLSPVIEELEHLANVDADTFKEAQLPSRVASDAQRALQILRAKRE
jgi:hypothetical protein